MLDESKPLALLNFGAVMPQDNGDDNKSINYGSSISWCNIFYNSARNLDSSTTESVTASASTAARYPASTSAASTSDPSAATSQATNQYHATATNEDWHGS